MEQYICDLEMAPFQVGEIFEDVDDQNYFVNTLFTEITNVHIPLKTRNIKAKQPPFMNAALRKVTMNQARLQHKTPKCLNSTNWENFRQQRNLITKIKRKLHQYTDKGLVCELTKLKIISASIPYCIKRNKQLTAFKDNLEKERHLLQENLDSNLSDINLDQFNTAQNELEHVEKHETRGLMLRSKTKWTEDGEQNTIFFLKQNYCNKLVKSLEVDGKLIKEHRNIAKASKHFFQNLYSEKLNPSNENH